MRICCVLNQVLNSHLKLKLTKGTGSVIEWESINFSKIFVFGWVVGFFVVVVKGFRSI